MDSNRQRKGKGEDKRSEGVGEGERKGEERRVEIQS